MFVETILASRGWRLTAQQTPARAAGYFVFYRDWDVREDRGGYLYCSCFGVIWGFAGALAFAEKAMKVGEPPLAILISVESLWGGRAPYIVELYCINLGARASGLGQAANAFGKIHGPLSLSFSMGKKSSNRAANSRGCTCDVLWPLVAMPLLFLG
jgi:hypothetical protein